MENNNEIEIQNTEEISMVDKQNDYNENRQTEKMIKILLENDLLKFTEDDLLGLTPYHARQIKSSGQVKAELIPQA